MGCLLEQQKKRLLIQMAFFFLRNPAVFCLCYWFEFFFPPTPMVNCLFVELEQSCRKPSAYTSGLCAVHTGVACVRKQLDSRRTENHRYARGKNVNIFTPRCKRPTFSAARRRGRKHQARVKWLLLSGKQKKNLKIAKSDSLDKKKNETN